ncbi:hypothetical protein BD410DRAFT_762651 [Rickenella mellea]|uniref:DNA-directed DNA polymerase n=1 Tax=Rickenella mellea TaxID=50990 RepID=A0A4Y7QIW5_9AGAM|nr:hypothetical protein BD410DRAFT_762651 [Rickenella mellea]
MTTTLPLYWGLSSSNKSERLDASVKLVGALEEFHAQYLTKSSPDDSEVDEDNEDPEERPLLEQFDSSNAQDVSYAIRRLIRGLGSPRESSRLGFAVALTELLTHVDTVSCAQIIALIHTSCEPSGSMTGQEERDVLFARLFGLSVIIQSGLLVRKKPMPMSSAIPSSLACFQTIVTDLLALGEKKSWLKESSWRTLINAVESVYSSEIKWREDAVRYVEQRLFVEDKSWSPEKVALALKLTTLYPSKEWKGLFSPPFKQPDILNSSNLVALARILKESNVDDSSEPQPQQSRPHTGSWKPQLHFVWDTIFDNLLYTGQTKRTSGNFQDFFRVVVDDSLFASSSSSERKYWGFLIFLKALHRLPSSDLPLLFTKNFMRCWINHLSNNDRYLHKVATKVASEIHAMVKKDPTAGFTLVLQLTGAHGARQFDRITKTRTVESILSSMDVLGITQYIDFLLSQVNGEDGLDSGPPLEARREWIADQFALLLRNGSIPKDNQWVSDALGWLTVHAFFDVIKKSTKSPHRALQIVPKPPFSEGLRTFCLERLLSCLAELTRPIPPSKSTDSRTIKAVGAASDDEFWAVKTIHMVSNLVHDGKHVRPSFSVDGEALNAFKVLTKTLHTLGSDSVSERSREPARGAQLLLAGMQLRNFLSSDDAAENDFDELQSCCRAATTTFVHGKQSDHVDDSVPSESEDAATPIDTLVDGIIGLLETSAALTREVANQSFAMLAGLVQQSTIDLILTQFERRDPEATADESEDDDEETESVTNDLAEQVKPSQEVVTESDSETDNSHSAVDSDDEDGNEPDTERLRMHLENVFATNGDPPNQRLSQDNSSDEESMDDDQMMAIDEQLASIFRTKNNEKKTTKDAAQRAATHFKNRVLDLVDIFIRKQPSNPLTVQLILPMVEVIMGTGPDERQLSDKATGIVRSRFGKPKEFPPNIDNRVGADTLKTLHSKARRAHSSDMVVTLSQCSVYMAKCMLPSGEASLLDVYKESFVDFATRKGSSLHPSFFLDFIRRFPSHGWALRRELLELASKSVNSYRQSQMFHLIQVILTQAPNTKPEEFTTFALSLRKALHSAILEASTNPNTTLNVTQAKEVLKTGLQVVRQTKRISTSQDLSRIWEPSIWDDLSQTLAASEQFKASKSLQDLCRQISRIAREDQKPGESAKESKRKAEENSHEGASDEKHRRKKVKKGKTRA